MNQRTKRILMCVLGVLICGVSIGFFKRAAFGIDPFQTFMSGLDAVIPIPFGTLWVIANVVLLMFSLLADRHYVGLATVINLLLVGYVSQFSHEFLLARFPDLSLAGRAVFLVIGIVMMCFSSAFYFTADLGVSTYDAISLIITNTWKIGKFRYVRITSDLICVILGVTMLLLTGSSISSVTAIAGIGTIITAFFMGPLIDFFSIYVAKPFLEGRAG